MEKTQIRSFQENVPDYLLSWLRSGSKAPRATLQTNLAHPPPCSPSKKDPPWCHLHFKSKQDRISWTNSLTSHNPRVSIQLSPSLADLQVFNSASSSSQYSYTS
ncbi:hypothetical protein AMECASPLE_030920 [Ameca splendens]|uniref:Uncharacterized protein n=1 Tax=Ameca splendens TaxID=208324 RepID=A0ABV1ACL0_9TELE